MIILSDLEKNEWDRRNVFPIKRAFLSSYIKDEQLSDFAKYLADNGVELVSSGGTATYLSSLPLKVITSEELTGLRSILEHRVATLHPKIHGGILAKRDDPLHQADMAEYDIQPFDLVLVNIYPFLEAITKGTLSSKELIEMIDIGGPTLLRGAAKNYKEVCAVSSPGQYVLVQEAIKALGGTNEHLRLGLAQEVFRMMSIYDSAVDDFLRKELSTFIQP